jgi:tetratricopeptide (TPR) repeat protein
LRFCATQPGAAPTRRRRAVAARSRPAARPVEGPRPARAAATLCGDAAGRGARARRVHQPACGEDIARWQDGAAPVVDVERLSDEAGAALLRDNGVWGTDEELKAAAHDFGGHPLALGLLASFLKETQTGDVRRRDRIRAYFADADNPRHDYARRVMESYEKEWLAGEPMLLAIMHMIGLFDRPASGDCLNALRVKPAIEGLTDQIVDLDESEWQRAIARLREVRLLAPPDPAARGALDAHPLVREWFGERLRQANEAAWKAAHGRLYEHLRDTTDEGKAPTLEDLAPLYQAIAHGCRAGRHQEAVEHICRWQGDGKPEYYAIRQLGAVGTDLTAIACFFEKPFERPTATLENASQSWILNLSSMHLRGQGRLSEALTAARASLKITEALKHWGNAGRNAGNLSEMELLVGDIASAVDNADKSVKYSDRSNSDHDKAGHRATCAYVRDAAGKEDAGAMMIEASRQWRESHPHSPLLYPMPGYYYCDILLSRNAWDDARDHAEKTINLAREHNWILQLALDTLTLGRAYAGTALADQIRSQRASAVREGSHAARCFTQ